MGGRACQSSGTPQPSRAPQAGGTGGGRRSEDSAGPPPVDHRMTSPHARASPHALSVRRDRPLRPWPGRGQRRTSNTGDVLGARDVHVQHEGRAPSRGACTSNSRDVLQHEGRARRALRDRGEAGARLSARRAGAGPGLSLLTLASQAGHRALYGLCPPAATELTSGLLAPPIS